MCKAKSLQQFYKNRWRQLNNCRHFLFQIIQSEQFNLSFFITIKEVFSRIQIEMNIFVCRVYFKDIGVN